MTLYHAFEIILVGAVVTACTISVARRFFPGLREWMHLGPSENEKSAVGCGSNSGCNGCSDPSKQTQH